MVQSFHRSQWTDKHSWLTMNGLHQVFLGSVQAQRQQVIAKHLLSCSKHLFDISILQESFPHTDKLTALAREQKHRRSPRSSACSLGLLLGAGRTVIRGDGDIWQSSAMVHSRVIPKETNSTTPESHAEIHDVEFNTYCSEYPCKRRSNANHSGFEASQKTCVTRTVEYLCYIMLITSNQCFQSQNPLYNFSSTLVFPACHACIFLLFVYWCSLWKTTRAQRHLVYWRLHSTFI